MLENLFGVSKPVIGVIHLLPLPGSPNFEGQLEIVCLRAEQEAAALSTGGVNAIIVENFFDAPFTKGRVDVATACALALVAQRVAAVVDIPVGVNVLRNDGLTALAVAATISASFIRVNVYTGAMLTDQGIIEGQAYELQTYRRRLGVSERVKIFADVMVKHADPLSPYTNITQVAKDTVGRGRADAVIVSGAATGSAPDITDLKAVRSAVPDAPLLVGSGATPENIGLLLSVADGVIAASSLKRQGVLENPVDVERTRQLVEAAKAASKQPGRTC